MYKRLTTKDESGDIILNCQECQYHGLFCMICTDYHCINALKTRLAELEDRIENGTLKEVVRCKDCVYFQPEYVEMENGGKRPYTEEEIKNGKCVTMEKGINCGSRCERFRYWKENQYPVWFNENAFCSYGKPKKN